MVALLIECIFYQVIDLVVQLLAKEMTKDPHQIQTFWYLPYALSVNAYVSSVYWVPYDRVKCVSFNV